MPRRLILIALLALGMASCATITPEARVRAALLNAGVKPPIAACMAHRMAKRLSIAQLRELQAAARLAKADARGRMTINEIVHCLRAIGDPEIVSVVSRAALGCEITGG